MEFTVDDFLENLYKNNRPLLSFSAGNKDEWETWRNDLKRVFMEKLCIPQKESNKLNPKVIEEVKMEGYIRQKVIYMADMFLQIPAYVLIPEIKMTRYPAVIACHGHGYGCREIIGLNPDGTENTGYPGYQKNFAVELVKNGFLVIAPELFGFGDRRLKEDWSNPLSKSSCYRISTYLMMLGMTTAGIRIRDIIRTVDYLYERDDVDNDRIGCMGISGGGLVCSFSTAVDDRIKAAVVSGFANTFKDSIMAMEHCIDNFIPGIVKYAEMPDLLGLIAPRPLLIEAGMDDHIFPVNSAQKAYFRLEGIYGLLNSKEKLDIDIFKGGHMISGQKAYSWFVKWLK